MINNMNGMYTPNNNYYMNGGYGTMVKLPKRRNVLTDQQLASLNRSKNMLEFDDVEIVQNSCNHIKNDGTGFSLEECGDLGQDGAVCTKCGERFTIVSDDLVTAISKNQYTIDLINTIQIYGAEIDQQLLLELGKVKAIVKKIPKIYDAVMITWNQKYAQYNMGVNNMGDNNVRYYDYILSGAAPLQNPAMMNQNMQNAGIYNGVMNPIDMNVVQNGYVNNPYYGQQQQNMNYPNHQNINMNYNGMGYQQPPVVQQMQQQNMNYPNQNMNMNNSLGMNSNQVNPFFENSNNITQQPPAYSKPPAGVGMQQQAQQQTSQQQYTPPKNSEDKKAVVTKPLNA